MRLAYGDFLKQVAHNIGWDGKKDERGRGFLQWLGEGIRGYYTNYWTDKMIEAIRQHSSWIHSGFRAPIEYFFLTDVRYLNEITEIEKVFPVVKVRIERPYYDNGLTEEQKNHISEVGLDNYDNWDYKIINDDTLEEYGEAVREVLRMECGGKERSFYEI